MALFGALGQWIGLTLTLAGVTGIIVSVGITADSYIVYFERIKENIRQGYEVDEAADEGFSAAFRTILTADTVSLISAVLLYTLAVGAVKGFALALGIATVHVDRRAGMEGSGATPKAEARASLVVPDLRSLAVLAGQSEAHA